MMLRPAQPNATTAMKRFEPEAGVYYSLDATARLAGVSRRTVLCYCRFGLIEASPQPPFGALYFEDNAIRTIRRIELLRYRHGVSLDGARLILGLMDEVERLRNEMQFFRGP